MNMGDYPYAQLVENLVAMDYEGWILLECRTKIEDPIAALEEQRRIFHEMIARARANLS
jgi:sugar phosphate isomerase/epimerase